MSSNNKDDKHSPSTASNKQDNEGATGGETEQMTALEAVRKFLAEKLSIKDDKSDKAKVLDEVSLDGIVQYIKTKGCKNIITLAGAGISTSAGIPDFRTPGSGLYDNLAKYNLPTPQAIFEIGYFIDNPKPFFALAKELYPDNFKPTICHYFIKLLSEKNLLLRHYSQNIDTLERVAGIPEEKLVEAHGTFHTGHCLNCRTSYTKEWMKDFVFDDKIPTCEKCSGIVKPDIVFFGETLPKKFYDLIQEDFPKCDLLIVMGSSLQVQPVAGLINNVNKDCPRLLINREKVGFKDSILAWMGLGGMNFDDEDNTRDVAWLGDCDDGCLLLADKLGFGEELRNLVKMEHERLEKEKSEEKKQKKTALKDKKTKDDKKTEKETKKE